MVHLVSFHSNLFMSPFIFLWRIGSFVLFFYIKRDANIQFWNKPECLNYYELSHLEATTTWDHCESVKSSHASHMTASRVITVTEHPTVVAHGFQHFLQEIFLALYSIFIFSGTSLFQYMWKILPQEINFNYWKLNVFASYSVLPPCTAG